MVLMMRYFKRIRRKMSIIVFVIDQSNETALKRMQKSQVKKKNNHCKIEIKSYLRNDSRIVKPNTKKYTPNDMTKGS